MSAKKENVYFGQVLTSQSERKYYRQSNLDGFVAITPNEEIEVSPSQALSIIDLSHVDDGADKFNFKGVNFSEKDGGEAMGKPTYRNVRIFNIIEKKDGSLAAKVACDQLIAFREGKKIKFTKGDYLNLNSKEDRLAAAQLFLDKGFYDQATYEAKVANINKTPDFVVFNLSGKGELV